MIYGPTKDFPKSEIYGITSRSRRVVISNPSNIAEGASRDSAKDRKYFYEIARSSLDKIDTQLEISMRLNYFNPETDSEKNEETIKSIFSMLTNLKDKTK